MENIVLVRWRNPKGGQSPNLRRDLPMQRRQDLSPATTSSPPRATITRVQLQQFADHRFTPDIRVVHDGSLWAQNPTPVVGPGRDRTPHRRHSRLMPTIRITFPQP